MRKPSPRRSVRKLASFDIRLIPKKPPAPSLTRRRSPQDAFRSGIDRALLDAAAKVQAMKD
jgi:hypothetical protein